MISNYVNGLLGMIAINVYYFVYLHITPTTKQERKKLFIRFGLFQLFIVVVGSLPSILNLIYNI